MTERDLERVLTQSVQDVHLSDAARRHIRLATKEERPVRSKKFVAIVLAVMLALTASVGIAEELGLFDFLSRMMGQTVLPGASELVKTDVAFGETDDVMWASFGKVHWMVRTGKICRIIGRQFLKQEKQLRLRNFNNLRP